MYGSKRKNSQYSIAASTIIRCEYLLVVMTTLWNHPSFQLMGVQLWLSQMAMWPMNHQKLHLLLVQPPPIFVTMDSHWTETSCVPVSLPIMWRGQARLHSATVSTAL